MKKEVSDALHFLLHCSLKDTRFTTQKEQFDIVYNEIERLNNIIKELDDYIDKNTEYNHDGDDYGYMEWYDIINVDTTTFINDINEILRKSDKE